MSSSWFSAFYNNHNKLKVPNHRFQCRKIKCALSIKVIYVDSKFTCGIFKRLSYGKDLLHSKWMLVHSYECRVIPSVNTIGNNQPTLLMPLKSWQCYGLIKYVFISHWAFTNIVLKILTNINMRSMKYILLMRGPDFCFNFLTGIFQTNIHLMLFKWEIYVYWVFTTCLTCIISLNFVATQWDKYILPPFTD